MRFWFPTLDREFQIGTGKLFLLKEEMKTRPSFQAKDRTRNGSCVLFHMNNPFSILVLDDNPVFLKAFHYRLSTHAQSLEVLWDCKVEVNACSTTVDFFKSLAQEPNFLILDYKLGNGLQADLLLKLIRGKGVSADSVIISEGSPKFTDSEKQQQQISAVLRKDSLLVPRSCIMIEERLFRHINQI